MRGVIQGGLLAELLPTWLGGAESFTDPPEAALLPDEEPLVARAVDKRRREVTTTRSCARQALAELGIDPAPIPRGERGEPVWPDGIVGSMTHCEGYRAAVAAHAANVLTVGIDAEPHQTLPDGVLDVVALPAEIEHLNKLSVVDNSVHWDRILFSCKESVYKSWFPIAREWLGFEDAELTFDPQQRTFHARLRKLGPEVDGAPLEEFDGRWAVRDGLTVTGIVRARR